MIITGSNADGTASVKCESKWGQIASRGNANQMRSNDFASQILETKSSYSEIAIKITQGLNQISANKIILTFFARAYFG